MSQVAWICALAACVAACTPAAPDRPAAGGSGSSAPHDASVPPVAGGCFEKAEAKCVDTPFGIEKSGCEAMGGTALPGPCPSADRIGTCRQLTQGVETGATHYYKGFAVDMDLKEFCESRPGSYRFVPEP
jgi:hypothetical protein